MTTRRTLLRSAAASAVTGIAGFSIVGRAQAQALTLNGASQFNDEHPYTMAMQRFADLIKQYYNQPVNFVMHKNSSLGLEKQYVEYMSAGRAVDFAVASPAHMSTFSKSAAS